MKIDILDEPRTDIFKNRGTYIALFNFFLATAAIGVLLGIYTIVAGSRYYDILEKVATVLFVGSSLPFFIVGEKLRARRRLSPEQEKELATLCRDHEEIQQFSQRVAASGRYMVFAEFEACQDFAEEKTMQQIQAQEKATREKEDE